jgi:hypothetical protein
VVDSRDHSLDPPKLSEASFSQVRVHPDLASQCKITLWNAHANPWQDPAPRRWQVTTNEQEPCSSNFGSWLVYILRNLEKLPISSLRTSPFHVFFLLILAGSLLWDPQALDCDSCMCTIQVAIVVTKTLVFHTYYSCAAILVGSCTHNHTTYSVCCHDGQCICFKPICLPQEQWLQVWSFTSTGGLISQTHFDVCVVIAKISIYWSQGIGNTCGGLIWEKTNMSNDKYVCQGDSSWPCNDIS